MLILDSDVLIEIERGNAEVIDSLTAIREQKQESVVITAPVYSECLFGFLKVGKEEEGREFLDSFMLLDFDRQSAALSAQIRHGLSKKGTHIPPFDLITASIALSNNATLVSSDKHFEEVPGLKLISL